MDVITAIRRSRLVLPMALLAAAGMLFISEGSYMRAVNATDSLRGMAEARAQISTLLQGVVDAETGQRGYLLTDRKEYLQPYRNALDQIGKSFEFLRKHYPPDANEQQNLGDLHALTQARLSVLAETIRLKSESKGDLAADVLMSGIGDEQMAAIRARAAEMLAREDARVLKRRDAIYHNLLLNRIGVAALTLFSLLALVLYLRRSAASDRQQVEQQRLLLAERDRLEVLVAQRTEVLTELTRHLSSAREDERGRLARELHDELGALLTSAKLDAARIKSRLAGSAPDAQERLAHLVETLNSGIALKRRIIEDLRPSALSNLGLVATLEILMREFSTGSGMPAHCTLEPVRLDANSDLVVYRVVQEAITNISKHAKAGQVWVGLGPSQGRVEVSVRDDGLGFNPTASPRSAHGLMGMRFRVESVGGALVVESAPGQGTLIRVTLPESPVPALA